MEKYLSTDLSKPGSYLKQQGRQWYAIRDGERLYWYDLYNAYSFVHEAIKRGDAHRFEVISADPATYGEF